MLSILLKSSWYDSSRTKLSNRTFIVVTIALIISFDCGVQFLTAMDVTAVIVKNTVLHESRSLTFVLSSTISFAQRKPDAVLLYIVDYLAHRSEHKGTAQGVRAKQ